MKKYLFQVAFLLSFSSMAQGVHELRIKIVGSPDYSFRLTDSTNDDKPCMRFRIGADVEYGLSNHIALRSGLRYVTSGFKSVINPKELSYNDMIDPQTGFIYQTSEMVPYLETTYHDYQIELPIVIKYFPKTKMGFHINGGLSILYFYKTVVTPNVYQPQHTHNLSRTLIGLNSGIGYDWKVSTKYFLSVDFLFRLNLTQTFAEPTFIHDSKAFSIGTEIGFGRILGNKTSE